MPQDRLSNFILFPHLEFQQWKKIGAKNNQIECRTRSGSGFCPRCGCETDRIYDHRVVRIKDAPLREKLVELKIKKKRFQCRECGKVFSETIEGIKKYHRVTERLKRKVLWACENFQDLKRVEKAFFVSTGFVYSAFYEMLELKRRTNLYPWPKVIGIDEHSFQKRRRDKVPFVSVVVDHKNKRIFEVVDSKTKHRLSESLASIPGRENVQWVTCDLSDSYKSWIKEFFPDAKIVADKFHALRLLNAAIIKERSKLEGNKWNQKARRLLLSSAHKLDWFDKSDLWEYLAQPGHERLKALYIAKEKLYTLFRTRGVNKARWALHRMIEQFKASEVREIKRLGKTLWRWAKEILNYFVTRYTNARVEGFNGKAKLVKKQAYGFRSFKNYRLRLIGACLP